MLGWIGAHDEWRMSLSILDQTQMLEVHNPPSSPSPFSSPSHFASSLSFLLLEEIKLIVHIVRFTDSGDT